VLKGVVVFIPRMNCVTFCFAISRASQSPCNEELSNVE
jgi:hypothetical protein